MTIFEIVSMGVAILGGGGIAGFFVGRKKRVAEGESVEVDTSIKLNREWERLYKELDDRYDKLAERVSDLESALTLERKEVARLKSAM